MPDSYLASPERIKLRQDLLQRFIRSAEKLLSAVNENAPFYPALIRSAANDTHEVVKRMIDKYLASFVQLASTGIDSVKSEEFITEAEMLVNEVCERVDHLESLIRERLAAIRVAGT